MSLVNLKVNGRKVPVRVFLHQSKVVGGTVGLLIGVVLVLAVFAAALALTMIPGAIVMLAIGVVHSFWPAIPALGFWASWVIYLALHVIFARESK